MPNISILLYKKPANRKGASEAELRAKQLSRSEVLVTSAGYYMKHHLGFFPELGRNYRVKFGSQTLDYRSLTEPEPDAKPDRRVKVADKKRQIRLLAEKGWSNRDIAELLELSDAYVCRVKKSQIPT